jgi:flagellar assembly factor FliW
MKLQTQQFGDLACSEEQVIVFPDGLPGVTSCRRFVVVNDAQTKPFQWLVAADETAFVLRVLDPAVVLSDEEPMAGMPEGKTTFVVATPGSDDVAWWLDLRHPIVIDHSSKRGERVTLDDMALPERFPVTKHGEQGGE